MNRPQPFMLVRISRISLATVVALGLVSCRQPQASVEDYFAAKDSLRTEARRQTVGGAGTAYYNAGMRTLRERLRPLIGFDSIAGSPLESNADIYGEMLGDGLDGLAGRVGRAYLLVTTPPLLAHWVRERDSTVSPLAALKDEDMLTWAFSRDSHVYPFADLKAKASLPADVFVAYLIAFGQDDPPGPDEILVGLQRSNRIYLLIDTLRTGFDYSAECRPGGDAGYLRCIQSHVDKNADFPRIAQQVKELVAVIPR